MFVCTTCRDPEHGRVTDPPFEGPVGGSFSHRSRLIRPASHGLRATSLGHSERFLGVSLGRVIQVGSEQRKAYVMLASPSPLFASLSFIAWCQSCVRVL